MDTRGHGTPVERARDKRPRVGAFLAAAAAATATLAACGPSPAEPAAGELSAVVVSRNDQPMLFGGGTVDSWSRVVVLTREQLLTAFETSWPGRETPDDHDLARVVIRMNVEELPPGRVAEVSDGHFRVPWQEAGRYLCLGNEYQDVVTTAGCVAVYAEAPAKVTLESSIGGFRLKT